MTILGHMTILEHMKTMLRVLSYNVFEIDYSMVNLLINSN